MKKSILLPAAMIENSKTPKISHIFEKNTSFFYYLQQV